MTYLLTFFTAFLISYGILPSVISIAMSRRVVDEPEPRKLQSKPVPLLGGVAIFAATVVPLTFFGARFFEPAHLLLLTSLLLLFFMGLRDDVSPLTPYVKLFGQFSAALIVVLLADIRLTGFYGLFGVSSIPYWIGFPLTILVFIFIINAVNLVDGLDGLAASLSLIAAGAFAIFFLLEGEYFFAVAAYALAGSLAGFFPYNIHPARVFMGDTGSMTVGMLLAAFSIKLISLSGQSLPDGIASGRPSAGIILVLSVLTVPMIDTLRVFMLRVLSGRSPFSADNNHLHHRLLAIGLNQKQVNLLLIFIQVTYLTIGYSLRNHPPTLVFAGLFISSVLLSQIPAFILWRRKWSQIS